MAISEVFFPQIWQVFSQKAFWVSESHWFFFSAPKWQNFDKEGNAGRVWLRRKRVRKDTYIYIYTIFQSPISDTVVGRHPHLNSTTLCTINVENNMYFSWIIWSKIREPYEHHQDTDWEYKMFVRKLWIQNSKEFMGNSKQTPTHPLELPRNPFFSMSLLHVWEWHIWCNGELEHTTKWFKL